MSLQIRRGPTVEAMRILVHGQEGVGKTTWAAKCPGAVTITIEDGGGDLDYARAVVPTWPELRQTVRELVKDPQGITALVIDTIDTYERALWDYLCRAAKVDSIEEISGGYGKGYTAATEEMTKLAGELDQLRIKHKVNIIVLAHSHVKAFQDPLGNPFDRYEVQMHKGAAAIWKGWADAVLFFCFDVTVKTGSWKGDADPTKKGKAVKARRVIYTTKDAAFDAKNRYNLPEEIDLTWAAFAKAIGWDQRQAALRPPATPAPPPEPPRPPPSWPTDWPEAGQDDQHDGAWERDQPRFFAVLDGTPYKYSDIATFLGSRGKARPSCVGYELRRALLLWLQRDSAFSSALRAYLATQAEIQAASTAPTGAAS
jgi:hypothetical protein